MDAEERAKAKTEASPFYFGLMVQTIVPRTEDPVRANDIMPTAGFANTFWIHSFLEITLTNDRSLRWASLVLLGWIRAFLALREGRAFLG